MLIQNADGARRFDVRSSFAATEMPSDGEDKEWLTRLHEVTDDLDVQSDPLHDARIEQLDLIGEIRVDSETRTSAHCGAPRARNRGCSGVWSTGAGAELAPSAMLLTPCSSSRLLWSRSRWPIP
jgi:hypothetical protein